MKTGVMVDKSGKDRGQKTGMKKRQEKRPRECK